jgi:hypothetical protein
MMRGAFTSVLRRNDAIEIAIFFPFPKAPKSKVQKYVYNIGRGERNRPIGNFI